MSSQREQELKLVRQAATEPDAFGELYERYVRKIYNYIYYRTGNHEDAEDLTARVFQRAMKHVANFQDQGVPFSAWLYRIAHNLVAMTAVQQLPPERQQLLILKTVERLSNAEIGAIMDRTEGAIKSLYHRTLNALREEVHKLDKEFPLEEDE